MRSGPTRAGAESLPRYERWSSIAIVILALGLWELLARLGWVSEVFFPAPTAIAAQLARSVLERELWRDFFATLRRVIAGLLLGGLPGLALGLAMGYSRRLRRIVDPLVAAAHPLPKIALLPLLLVLFGIGDASKVAMAAVGAFFPMLINSSAGVLQLSAIHFDVARNYGAGPLLLWRRVVLPGSLPSVLPGLRIAFNVAMVLTLATELVAAQEGLGRRIWYSWQTFRVEELYASLVLIAAVGLAFNLVLQAATDRAVPWYRERRI